MISELREQLAAGTITWMEYHLALLPFYDKNVWHYTGKEQS